MVGNSSSLLQSLEEKDVVDDSSGSDSDHPTKLSRAALKRRKRKEKLKNSSKQGVNEPSSSISNSESDQAQLEKSNVSLIPNVTIEYVAPDYMKELRASNDEALVAEYADILKKFLLGMFAIEQA